MNKEKQTKIPPKKSLIDKIDQSINNKKLQIEI